MALAGLIVVFFWPLITPDPAERAHIVGGDFTNQFWPYHYFAAAEWWAHRIPLWNPYSFGGHPFQADIQTAVFYPLALLTNLLVGRGGLPLHALEVEGIVDYLLAAAFSYLFIRTVTSDRLAGLLGAATFTLGGYLTSYPFQQFAVLETSIWLPLVLLLIEVGIRHANRLILWQMLAGLALAVAILAGHPQSVLYIACVAVAYLLFKGWCARLQRRLLVGGALTFALAAIAGAAVQLLPTAELTVLSTRAAISYATAATGYDYVALAGLLLPFWRGEKALYLGIAPLLLALFALRQRPRGSVWFWAGTALVALALSFGDRGLLYRLFHAIVPGFAAFQDQERSAFVFSFAGAVLAGLGLASLRRSSSGISPRALAVICAVLASGAALAVILFWTANDVVSGSVDLATVGFPRLIALLVIAALALSIGSNRTGERALSQATMRTIAIVAVVALTVVDIWSANWQNNLSAVDSAAPSKAQLAAIGFLKAQEGREGEPLRVRPQSDVTLPANYGAIASLPFAAGDSPIIVQRTQDVFGSPQEWRLWQLLNVKYVVGNGPPGETLEQVFGAPPVAVYRNRFSLPRAWVVRDVRYAETAERAKEMVLDGKFRPGESAVVEVPLTIPAAPQLGEAPFQQQINFDYYSPRRVLLHTTTNRDGLLVLSETSYPGWQAKLDGLAVPILHADYMLRGIVLPAGEHRLEMVYNPTTFWLGFGISVLAWLCAICVGVIAFWRARSKRGGEG